MGKEGLDLSSTEREVILCSIYFLLIPVSHRTSQAGAEYVTIQLESAFPNFSHSYVWACNQLSAEER